MKRGAIGVALTPLVALSLSGQAAAAPSHGAHLHTSGPYADSHWITDVNGGFVETTLAVSQSSQGGILFIDRLVVSGTGATDTTVDVTDGFSFSIDTATLSEGNLSATNLPTTVCVYDTQGNPVGDCTSGTLSSVDVAWSGHGPINHSVTFEHVSGGGHTMVIHVNGKIRLATATGTYEGSALGDSDHAHLGTANSIQIKH